MKLARLATTGALCLLAAAGTANAESLKIGASAISLVNAAGPIGLLKPELFKSHDLDAEVIDMRGSSPNCINAVLSGTVDICQAGTTTGMDAIAEGADLQVIAVLVRPAIEIVMAKRVIAEKGFDEAAPIEKKIADLKGLTFTSSPPGNANYTLLTEAFKLANMTPADVQYQTLTDTTAMIASMQNDRVDVAMWSVGPLSNLIKDGTGVRWISTARGDIPAMAEIPYVSVFATRKFVEENPDLAERIHAAYADIIAYMKANPEEAATLFHDKYFSAVDPELWADSYGQASLAYFDGAMGSKEGWDLLLKLQAASTGKSYDKVQYDDIVAAPAKG